MPDESTISALITELDGFANAPMTAAQRVSRAQQVTSVAGVTLDDIKDALRGDSLSWKRAKAVAFGVTPEQWQEALNIVQIHESADFAALLDALHRAESAAAMLRAGYKASKGPTGAIAWIR
jgi:hypothetical protein